MAIERIVFCPLHGKIKERRVTERSLADALGLEDLGILSPETIAADPPDHTLIVVQVEGFDPEAATFVAGLREKTRSPIVVRYRVLAGVAPGWFRHEKVSAVPRDLANGVTIMRCIRAAMEAPFLPRRPGGVEVTGSGELSDFLRRLNGDIDTAPGHVALGVFALPRSGSKALADMLTLWAYPMASVFHGHGLSEGRSEEIRRREEEGNQVGERGFLLEAWFKQRVLDKMRQTIASSTRLVLFLAERDPIERIYSAFAIRRSEMLDSFAAGEVDASRVQRKLNVFVSAAVDKIATWYHEEYGPFGFGPDAIDMRGRGFCVAESDRAALVVLRTEGREPLLRDTGLWSDLASSNSSRERGIGGPRGLLGQDFTIQPELVDRLYSNPWIAAMHGRPRDPARHDLRPPASHNSPAS